MLHTETVRSDTFSLLKKLQQSEVLYKCPLAGGTALALQIGHRVSIDLDFFSPHTLNLEIVKRSFDIYPESMEMASSLSIITYSINKVKVDVVNYGYPPLYPYCVENDNVLYSLQDIAAIKLEAIKGRGKKRDFYDLFFLLQVFTLGEMLEFNIKKFNSRNPFMVLKSLSYFVDAENDPEIEVPEGANKFEWKEVKSTIIQAGRDHL